MPIKLGETPATFAPITVPFRMPDGAAAAITATFRYRTRTQFGELLDEMIKEAGQSGPLAPTAYVDFGALLATTGAQNAKHLAAALHSWSLDEPVDEEHLGLLCDVLPGAAAALMAAYSNACLHGRLEHS